jgi:hypothetical protein
MDDDHLVTGMGKRLNAFGTRVERHSRYVMLFPGMSPLAQFIGQHCSRQPNW